MCAMLSGVKRTVPFSAFDEGRARQIFAEVRHSGTKIVVNDDDSAECVLMSPEDYVRISDDYNNVRLMAVAEDRLKHFDRSKLISQEEFDRMFGITPEDLEGWEDIELE